MEQTEEYIDYILAFIEKYMFYLRGIPFLMCVCVCVCVCMYVCVCVCNWKAIKNVWI